MKTCVALIISGLCACTVAELEPLPDVSDGRDTREVEVSAPETGEPEVVGDTSVEHDAADTMIELDTADTMVELDAADTMIELDVEDDTLVEPDAADAADTMVEHDAADTMVEHDAADTMVEHDAADTVGSEDVGDPGRDVANACNTVIATHPIDPSPHVEACSEVTYATNPPTSGPHYPAWAAFKTYTNPVNPGFLVHSLEHGGIVIQYRCDDAPCADDLAALADFIAARPADPSCVEPLRTRLIVTPSPTLETRFAASAWGASLRSDCFDLVALATFIDAHYAMAPEDFCADGVDLDAIAPGSALYCPP